MLSSKNFFAFMSALLKALVAGCEATTSIAQGRAGPHIPLPVTNTDLAQLV